MKLLDRVLDWMGFVDHAPVVPKPAPTAMTEQQWGRVMEMLQPVKEPRRELCLPEVLPGVRPAKAPTGSELRLAMDSGVQETMAMDNGPVAPAAWGFGGNGTLGPGLSFLGFPYLAELSQISEYRIPAESLASEMTRRWMKLKNIGDGELDEKIHDITERMEKLKVRECFREAAFKEEMFGRSHLMVNIKGQDDDVTRQLPLTEIERGTLLGFACIEPYWLTPYSWNSTQPERPDFYKPQSWYVLGKKTHATRLLTFIFREVPDLLKPAYDFSGISIFQLMMPYVNRWLRTAKNVNDLINIFSIVTLSTDLSTLLQDPAKFMARVQGFTQSRDNRGMMMINKGTEELTNTEVSLGSLDKLQAQAQEHMATPARMPLIEFFGITPAGLNASSEGEMQVRNKNVKGMQELGFSKHFERVLHLVQMDMYGEVDEDITFEWQPLYEPSGKELAEIRKADTDRAGALIEKNVISPDEERERLQTDPESGYNNLEGDAPEPQEWSGGLEDDDEEGDDKGEKDDKPPAKKKED